MSTGEARGGRFLADRIAIQTQIKFCYLRKMVKSLLGRLSAATEELYKPVEMGLEGHQEPCPPSPDIQYFFYKTWDFPSWFLLPRLCLPGFPSAFDLILACSGYSSPKSLLMTSQHNSCRELGLSVFSAPSLGKSLIMRSSELLRETKWVPGYKRACHACVIIELAINQPLGTWLGWQWNMVSPARRGVWGPKESQWWASVAHKLKLVCISDFTESEIWRVTPLSPHFSRSTHVAPVRVRSGFHAGHRWQHCSPAIQSYGMTKCKEGASHLPWPLPTSAVLRASKCKVLRALANVKMRISPL